MEEKTDRIYTNDISACYTGIVKQLTMNFSSCGNTILSTIVA